MPPSLGIHTQSSLSLFLIMTVFNTQSAYPALYNILSPFDIRHISRKHIRGFQYDLCNCLEYAVCEVCLLVTDTKKNISLQKGQFCLKLPTYKVCISVYVYTFVIVCKQTPDLETGRHLVLLFHSFIFPFVPGCFCIHIPFSCVKILDMEK